MWSLAVRWGLSQVPEGEPDVFQLSPRPRERHGRRLPDEGLHILDEQLDLLRVLASKRNDALLEPSPSPEASPGPASNTPSDTKAHEAVYNPPPCDKSQLEAVAAAAAEVDKDCRTALDFELNVVADIDTGKCTFHTSEGEAKEEDSYLR